MQLSAAGNGRGRNRKFSGCLIEPARATHVSIGSPARLFPAAIDDFDCRNLTYFSTWKSTTAGPDAHARSHTRGISNSDPRE